MGLVLLSLSSRAPISEEELERRVIASKPSWERYQEDIKGQIGARPVAEWEGAPAEAVIKDGELHVAFAVTGIWATRDLAIPILIRDPAGNVFQSSRAAHRDGVVDYSIVMPRGVDASTLSWIEVRFPGKMKRLIPRSG